MFEFFHLPTVDFHIKINSKCKNNTGFGFPMPENPISHVFIKKNPFSGGGLHQRNRRELEVMLENIGNFEKRQARNGTGTF
jgi:hypothetical protein